MNPIAIEEEINFTIEADFLVDVPMPVVVISPEIIDLGPFERGEKDRITFNFTNTGLIRADDIQFELPSGHDFLIFETFVDDNYLGHLEAKETKFLTVYVRRITERKALRRGVSWESQFITSICISV